MFWTHDRARPHAGHAEAGHTIEVPRGRRWMHTLRKLPMTAPKSAAKVSAKGPVISDGALLVRRAAGTVPRIGTAAHGHPKSVRTACRSDRLECGEIPGREGPSPNRPADCPEPSPRRQVSIEGRRFHRARGTA